DAPANPSLTISGVSAPEGNSGMTAFAFTVNLSAAGTQTVTVDYAAADGTATAAGNDYQPASGTLTFAPGQTSQTVTVLVSGDTVIEPDEVFYLNLTNGTNASISSGQAACTIRNDDTAISIDNATQAAGSGTTPFTFTVSLAMPSALLVKVNYATANGTARSG